MTTTPRWRILVAVEPTVLEGALACLLGDGERSDVVQFRSASAEDLDRSYDAAILSHELQVEVRANVVITFPAAAAPGTAHVRVGGIDVEVPVRSQRDVVGLLESQFGAALPSRPLPPRR